MSLSEHSPHSTIIHPILTIVHFCLVFYIYIFLNIFWPFFANMDRVTITVLWRCVCTAPTEQRPYNVPWGDVICLSKWADTVTECPINVAKYDFFSISLRTSVWFVLWLHHVWKMSQSLLVKCVFLSLQRVIENSIYQQQYKTNLCHVWLQGLGALVFYWRYFLFLSKNYCQSQQVVFSVSSQPKTFFSNNKIQVLLKTKLYPLFTPYNSNRGWYIRT